MKVERAFLEYILITEGGSSASSVISLPTDFVHPYKISQDDLLGAERDCSNFVLT